MVVRGRKKKVASFSDEVLRGRKKSLSQTDARKGLLLKRNSSFFLPSETINDRLLSFL